MGGTYQYAVYIANLLKSHHFEPAFALPYQPMQLITSIIYIVRASSSNDLLILGSA